MQTLTLPYARVDRNMRKAILSELGGWGEDEMIPAWVMWIRLERSFPRIRTPCDKETLLQLQALTDRQLNYIFTRRTLTESAPSLVLPEINGGRRWVVCRGGSLLQSTKSRMKNQHSNRVAES